MTLTTRRARLHREPKSMPLRLTPQMKQRMTRRTLEMVQRSLGYFPELKDAAITIGYTRKHLGSATVIYR